MMRYNKQADDVQYRRINTANLEEEEFGEFPSSGCVDYHDGCVVEILRRDGTTHIAYEGRCRSVPVNADGDCLYFPVDLPRARLWLRDQDGICYKVPMRLQERDGNAYVMVRGGFRNAELCGDPYFEAVYELRRKY